MWRGVRARLLARRGEFGEAQALARAAVALAEPTDFVNHRAEALLDLSYVLESPHADAHAVVATSDALTLFESKGNVVAASVARRRLGELV
jgi:hypothetical protein